MIESVHRSPSSDFAARCDEAFGTPGNLRPAGAAAAGRAVQLRVPVVHPYEAQAAALQLFEHSLVPGLLQTEAYARAVLETHPNTSQNVIEERVAARMNRQQILDRDDPPPPLLWVLLDETVLTREIGGPKTMHGQLAHLAEPGPPARHLMPPAYRTSWPLTRPSN
jgi:hypothetical protein